MAGTVTVACKLPHGLQLELKGADGQAVRVPVKGNAAARRLEIADDKGNVVQHEGIASVQGGYGLTHGVDADFWAQWLKENADYAPVKNGMIFATAKGESAASKAREQAEIRTGFEPIDPLKPRPGIQPLDRNDNRQAA